ncbi:MAG: Zn-ribbon domain-containing OB-fold protein [Candidatus Bathyarchaeia archaeon]
MVEAQQFTIEQFYKCASQGKLLGGKCRKCGKLHFPPRPLCDVCFSKEFEWLEVSSKGLLLTYTVIHVAPAQFQSFAPYAVGIVQLENGVNLPGMIKDVPHDQLKVGMPLTVVFEGCKQAQQWPNWPVYYFKKA